MDIPLVESASVTLSAGAGIIQLGPARSRDTWIIDSIAVTCSTAVKESQARIYAGHAMTQANFVGGTFTGSSGDTTDTVNKVIHAGEYVFASFSGGDASAIATVNVYGTKRVA